MPGLPLFWLARRLCPTFGAHICTDLFPDLIRELIAPAASVRSMSACRALVPKAVSISMSSSLPLAAPRCAWVHVSVSSPVYGKISPQTAGHVWKGRVRAEPTGYQLLAGRWSQTSRRRQVMQHQRWVHAQRRVACTLSRCAGTVGHLGCRPAPALTDLVCTKEALRLTCARS